MKVTPNNSTNFRGIHIANAVARVNNAGNSFKLYKLTNRDADYLDYLRKRTNLAELMPNLSEMETDIWQSVFSNAVNTALVPNRNTFLIASDNKPCGLAVSSKGYYNRYKLNQICTFPVECGKRIALAGKTLFRPVFDEFLNSKCKGMELEALKFGPFGAISKYKELGFGMCGGSNYAELMRISPQRVQQTLKYLDDLISYTPMRGGGGASQPLKDVDLFTELR